jgi:phosphoribosyl 1,2-cyclic phosphate phosphodiesterase
MELLFLGTAAAEGFSNVICTCANCTAARRAGRPSLRKRCSVLIDGQLLIDLGPDLMAAGIAHGVALHGVR